VSSDRDSNPEVDALGIDVESLVGCEAREIREALREMRDAALIVGTDGVPDGWPREILDVDASKDRMVWFFQTADGEWFPFYAYSYRKYVVEFCKIPACIYTRKPSMSPFARVRPIVDLMLDSSGRCLHASARWTEHVLMLARRHRDPSSAAPTPDVSIEIRPSTFRTAIEHVERALGLPSPTRVVSIDDFPTDDAGRLSIRLACIGEERGFLVCDASERPRLDVKIVPTKAGELRVVGASGGRPVAPLGSDGLRIALLDDRAVPRLWLDLFAGSLNVRIGDDRGIQRAVQALVLAGPADASLREPRPTAVTLALMAAGSSDGDGSDGSHGTMGLLVDVPRGLLSVRNSQGVVRAQLSATAIDGERAAYVFAEGRDAPPPDRH
jgi:hypothetical protein